MIIVGAGGHAREVLDIIDKENLSKGLFFFNDTAQTNYKLLGYDVLTDFEQAKRIFEQNPEFVVATGNPTLRYKLTSLMEAGNGTAVTVKANTSVISNHNVEIGSGANIMSFTIISNNVKIGKGCLINARANIHHDVTVGDYCEIAPGALLLGNVLVGDFTMIGAGAVVLPNLTIGRGCIVAAGAVVTKNIPDNSVAVGVPAVFKPKNLNQSEV